MKNRNIFFGVFSADNERAECSLPALRATRASCSLQVRRATAAAAVGCHKKTCGAATSVVSTRS